MNGALMPGDLSPLHLPESRDCAPLLRHNDCVFAQVDLKSSPFCKFAIFKSTKFLCHCTKSTSDQLKTPFVTAGRKNILAFEPMAEDSTKICIYRYVGGSSLDWVASHAVKKFPSWNFRVSAKGREVCIALPHVLQAKVRVGLMYFSDIDSGRMDMWDNFAIDLHASMKHFSATPFITSDHFGAVLEIHTERHSDVYFAWYLKFEADTEVIDGPWKICKVPGRLAVTACRNDVGGKNLLYVWDLVNYAHFEIQTRQGRVIYKDPLFEFKLPADICIRYKRGFFFAFQLPNGKLRVRICDDEKKRSFNYVVKLANVACVTDNCTVYMVSGGKTLGLNLSRF